MLLDDGLRFLRGLRSLRPAEVHPEDVEQALRRETARRGETFLDVLDTAVWPSPRSPTRQLLEVAGSEPGDVRKLVRERGLEAALEALRDAGVRVSHEEWSGATEVRRGSTVLALSPRDFFNPRWRPDVLGTTGGSRSRGLPAAASFADLRAGRLGMQSVLTSWSLLGAPTAVWLPVLPSVGGVLGLLRLVSAGNPPEAWFSQVDRRDVRVSRRKQLTNSALPTAARLVGVPLPAPVTVPPTAPSVVLEWAAGALLRQGRAFVLTYGSSGLHLARCAADAGQRLDGLVLGLTGEPLTPSRAREVAQTGARTIDVYATSQFGTAAATCPHGGPLHVLETSFGLVTRRRDRPDGVPVDALLWTTLRPTSGSILVNVENDDYGDVLVDPEPCGCAFGRTGGRRRLRDVRGMSKVVASGVTVRGDVFGGLVERLAGALGGSSADYQFVEQPTATGVRLVLRVDPRATAADDDQLIALVRQGLRGTEPGRLADDVWAAEGALGVVRAAPVRTAAGKVLPLHVQP
jgi:hypothetical protein